MADGDGRPSPAGQGRRGPILAGRLVAQVNRLTGRVGDRVIGPGRQTVHLAVAGPGVAGPGLCDEAAGDGIGQDVDPRGRGEPRAAGDGAVDDDDVLVTVPCEASEAVPKDEIPGRRVGPWRCGWCWRVVCRQFRRHGGRCRLAPELLGQHTAIAQEDRPCRGFDQHPAVVGHRARRENEHAAGLAEQGAGRAALQIAHQSVNGLAGPLVEDDEVEIHAPAADIAVPLHKLAGQRIVISRPESGQHDRPVAGDGERPEARLSQPVGG